MRKAGRDNPIKIADFMVDHDGGSLWTDSGNTDANINMESVTVAKQKATNFLPNNE
jgi:hypothetical protein